MVNRIVSVHAGICGIRIYAIMLPSSVFSVAHTRNPITMSQGFVQTEALVSRDVYSDAFLHSHIGGNELSPECVLSGCVSSQ